MRNISRRRWARRAAFLPLVLSAACTLQEAKKVTQEVAPLYSADSPEFRQAAGSLLGGNFVSGNNITTLVNGREIFPAMLSAIRAARRSIDFETYIFWDGEIAKKMAEALAERAQAGVTVNAILDAQGTEQDGKRKPRAIGGGGRENGEVSLHRLARSPAFQ